MQAQKCQKNWGDVDLVVCSMTAREFQFIIVGTMMSMESSILLSQSRSFKNCYFVTGF